MKRIILTGSSGFIGCNLAKFIRQNAPDLEVVEIPREFWNNENALAAEISRGDLIFHLAGESRSKDGEALYQTNMALARKLVAAVQRSPRPTTLLLGSTTHSKDTPYHRSKRDAEALFAALPAPHRGGAVLMPNTFGPHGKPYYNSVVATFCAKIAAHEAPQILEDAPLALIFVERLCRDLVEIFRQTPPLPATIPEQYHLSVSELLARLQDIASGAIPRDALSRDLKTTLDFYRNNC